MIALELLQTRLSLLSSLHDLRALFADFSYEADFSPIFLAQATKADERAQESLINDPEIIARAGEFQIIYAPLKDWNRAIGSERLIISRLLNDHPFALWIFSDESKTRWHFVNVKRGGKEVAQNKSSGQGDIKRRHVLRRISLNHGRKPGRTICERLAQIDTAEITKTLFGVSELSIQAAHDAAFDVESITLNFYKGYRHVVGVLQRHLKKESKDAHWAHEQALQTLNRLMFLRFVQHRSFGNKGENLWRR